VLWANTDDLPVTTERELWSPEFLARMDDQVRACEEKHRDEVHAACRRLIARFKRVPEAEP
jgi:hypothetical protein